MTGGVTYRSRVHFKRGVDQGDWMGGGGGVGVVGPHFITSKPLMIRSQKLHKILYSSFSTPRHNLIDTMT